MSNAIQKMREYLKHSILIERWGTPDLSSMPTVRVGNKKFHYEKKISEKFGPSYFLHGKSGARYGLFSGTNNELFALNMKNKKIANIGKFIEKDGKLIWTKTDNNLKYISEIKKDKLNKNVHMEHIEDRIIDNGSFGAKQSIRLIESLAKSLSSNTKEKKNITTKWDGSPAIFSGQDPETNQFFVGTKSVFNVTPKVNFTHEDIDKNHEGGLAKKLHVALDTLKDLGIEGVLQGDILYTKEDLEKKEIGGETVVAFRPNTILYAVPLDSEIANDILQSEIGVVFHTTYVGGPTLQDMKATFGADVSTLHQSSKAWIQDATYKDVSGLVTLTSDETETIKSYINKATQILEGNGNSFDELSENESIKVHLKTFNNSKIRQGEFIKSPQSHFNEFIDFISVKHDKEIEKVKTDKSKQAKTELKNQSIEFLEKNKKNYIQLFNFMKLIVNCKNIIIKKLQAGKFLTKSFIPTDTGFDVTNPEGFVAIDNDGSAVKLVDRLEFSLQNFTAAKNWATKQEKTEEAGGIIKEEPEVTDPVNDLTPVIVVSGRFQGFQKGHDSLIQEAKTKLSEINAEKVAIVVVEGKKTTGDPKNPLLGQERVEMLEAIYRNDPEVVVISKPSPIGFIVSRSEAVLSTVVNDGYYIRGWVSGSDRADEYQKMVQNFKEKESYHNDIIKLVGFLPVEKDEQGNILLDVITVDRDESGEGSGLGSIANFSDKENENAQRLFNKIISTDESVIPKEVMSGSIVRNLISVWGIDFDSWFKEVVPPKYNNQESKEAYRILYDRFKKIMIGEEFSRIIMKKYLDETSNL